MPVDPSSDLKNLRDEDGRDVAYVESTAATGDWGTEADTDVVGVTNVQAIAIVDPTTGEVITEFGTASGATVSEQETQTVHLAAIETAVEAANASFLGDRVASAASGLSFAAWNGMKTLAVTYMVDLGNSAERFSTVRNATGGTGAGSLAVGVTPASSSTVAATTVKTAAAAGSQVAKTSAGNLYGVNVAAANAGYVMVYDAISAPADGATTPHKVFQKLANEAFQHQFDPPVRCGTGITVVFSSTGPFTKTIDTTAFISVDYL